MYTATKPTTICAVIATAFLLIPSFANAATTLSAGDVSFTQFHSNATELFSFVIWKDIDDSTVISFTDNGNDGGGEFNDEEGVFEWTSGSAFSAGTVVTVSTAGPTVASGKGSIAVAASSPSTFVLSSGGDQIFAFQGTYAGTFNSNDSGTITGTLLYGIQADNNGAWSAPSGGDISAIPSALPASLVSHNIILPSNGSDSWENGEYLGTRNFASVAAAQAAVNDIGNWGTFGDGNNGFSGNDTNFTIVPEPGTAILVLFGLFGFCVRRRKLLS